MCAGKGRIFSANLIATISKSRAFERVFQPVGTRRDGNFGSLSSSDSDVVILRRDDVERSVSTWDGAWRSRLAATCWSLLDILHLLHPGFLYDSGWHQNRTWLSLGPSSRLLSGLLAIRTVGSAKRCHESTTLPSRWCVPCGT